RLDDIATETPRGAADDLARLGFDVAHAIDPRAPGTGPSASSAACVAQIAGALRAAQRPLVVAGTSSGSDAVINAAANVAWALQAVGRAARLAFVVPECNSVGVSLLGGSSLAAAADATEREHPDTLIVLENDLFRRG